MTEKSVVDQTTDEVTKRLSQEFKGALGPLTDEMRSFIEVEAAKIFADMQERGREAVKLAAAEAIAVGKAAVAAGVAEAAAKPIKADARDRAWRTTLQGGIATIVIGVLVAVGELVSSGGVDFFTSSGWKVLLGTASGAAVMAVSAYIQRITNPPKETPIVVDPPKE